MRGKLSQIDIENATAYVAGYRKNCVRLQLQDGSTTGFATFTYSFDMPLYLQQHYAKEMCNAFNAIRRGNK